MAKKNSTSKPLSERLSPEQYRITQQKGTEMPFTGEYYKTDDKGMYTCVVCGAPLFSSQTKFESGSGWPSFYKPVDKAVAMHDDGSGGIKRTEVVCQHCGAHLGHVFNDAPDQPTGRRFCINSAALKLEKEKSQEVR